MWSRFPVPNFIHKVPNILCANETCQKTTKILEEVVSALLEQA